jgi:hypothetical protein
MKLLENQITILLDKVRVDDKCVGPISKPLSASAGIETKNFIKKLGPSILAMLQTKQDALKKYLTQSTPAFPTHYTSEDTMKLMSELAITLDRDDFPILMTFKSSCINAVKPVQPAESTETQAATLTRSLLTVNEAELIKEMDEWVKAKLLSQMAPLSPMDQCIQQEVELLMQQPIGQTRMIKPDILFRQVKKLVEDSHIDPVDLIIIRLCVIRSVVQMLLPCLFAELKTNDEIESIFNLINHGYSRTRHMDFSNYLNQIDGLAQKSKETSPLSEEASKLMKDLLEAEHVLPRYSTAPHIESDVPLRRLDRLAIVLQPASDSQCVAIAIDHAKRNFIIGSNANDAKGEEDSKDIAARITTNIAGRLELIQITARLFREKLVNMSPFITKLERRNFILQEMRQLRLLERMTELGGYVSQKDIDMHLVKIIDSYIFEPAVFGCRTVDEVDELFTLRTEDDLPRQVIMVPDIELVERLQKSGEELQHMKVSGIHAEQLVILQAVKDQIPLTNGNVGISKPCCGVCARLFRERFPQVNTSAAHENIFPHTANLVDRTMTTKNDIVMLKDTPLKREDSGCTPDDISLPAPIGMIPILNIDAATSTPNQRLLDIRGSQSPYSPRFHKTAPAALSGDALDSKNGKGLDDLDSASRSLFVSG